MTNRTKKTSGLWTRWFLTAAFFDRRGECSGNTRNTVEVPKVLKRIPGVHAMGFCVLFTSRRRPLWRTVVMLKATGTVDADERLLGPWYHTPFAVRAKRDET